MLPHAAASDAVTWDMTDEEFLCENIQRSTISKASIPVTAEALLV